MNMFVCAEGGGGRWPGVGEGGGRGCNGLTK